MSAVQECLAITQNLVDRVNNSGESSREKVIGQVEEMLAKREELLPKIRPPFSSQEKAAGKEILELNKKLAFLLQGLNKHIIRDLNAVDLKKTFAAKYTNPYAEVLTDSVFYDKRQ